MKNLPTDEDIEDMQRKFDEAYSEWMDAVIEWVLNDYACLAHPI